MVRDVNAGNRDVVELEASLSSDVGDLFYYINLLTREDQ